MSKDKLSISEIIDMMIKKGNTGKREAEEFIKNLLATIEEALLSGENVKVKGFGTFKSQWNEARRSVDVNTGNDIIIPGFYRVVFQPDSDLREVINEPFAHLQTILLADDSVVSDEKNNVPDILSPAKDMDQSNEKADAGLSFFSAQAAEIKDILLDINALNKKSKNNTIVQEDEPIEIAENNNDNITHRLNTENQHNVGDTNNDSIIDPDDSITYLDDEEDNVDSTNQIITPITDQSQEFDIVRDVSLLYYEQDTSENKETGSVADEAHAIQPVINEEEEKISSIEDEDLSLVISKEQAEETSDEKEVVTMLSTDNDEAEAMNTDEATMSPETPEEPLFEPVHVTAIENNLNKEQTTDELKSVKIEDENDDKKEKKSKVPLFLLALSLLVASGVTAYFLTPYLNQIRKEKKNQKRLEYIADSLSTAKKVQQILDSISNLNTINTDTLPAADTTVVLDTLPSSLSEVKPTKPSTVQREEPQKNNASAEDIYSKPRKYTETLAVERMVAGSQLTKFARRYYGHSYFWVYIYEANKSKIKNPNNVPTGIEIKIPKLDSRLVDANSQESLNYALKLQSKYLK